MAAVIFDLDGTLVDSAPDIHAAVNRLLADVGEAPLPFQTVKGFIGNGVPTLVARVLHACGHGPEPARQTAWQALFLRHYEADSTTLTQPYPGVSEALSALLAQGHQLALCTNKPEGPARQILDAFGLAGLFPVGTACRCASRIRPRCWPLQTGWLARSCSWATARWMPKPPWRHRCRSCCSPKATARCRSMRCPMPRGSTGFPTCLR